jgi:hypothetical protein
MNVTTGLRTLLVAALLAAPSVLGHGGGHKPPGPPEPPPPPAPPPPPPWSGPGGGGARTPGGSGGPAVPGRAGPSAPRGRRATPGSTNPAPQTPLPTTGFDPTSWEHWWSFNSNAFIDLKDSLWRVRTATGSDEFFLGAGGRTAPAASLRPSRSQLAERIIPGVIAVLEKGGRSEILSGCLMSLAKIGAMPSAAEASTPEVLARFVADGEQQMGETAALALGVLGGADALFDLAALASDDERGREICGGGKVSTRTRAFAAYGLGLLARRNGNEDIRRFAVHRLTRLLAADDTGSHDLGVACVSALGLIELPVSVDGAVADGRPPGTSREALAAFLLERFADRELSDRVRAHLPRALTAGIDPRERVADSESLRARVASDLIEALKNTRTDREIVYGCVLALGRIGNAGGGDLDARIRKTLFAVAAEGDVMARHFSLIALAQVASTPGPGEGGIPGAAEVDAFLLKTLARGKSRARPWAALALGVKGDRLRRRGLEPSASISDAVRTALDECGTTMDIGAYALAAGLRRDVAARELIAERFFSVKSMEARTHLAVALGLLGERSSIEALRAVLPEAAWQPDLLRGIAVGLGLLGDGSLVDDLVKQMEETDSTARKGVCAWTLALVGDARAVEPIMALLEDESVSDLVRGIAALAIGFIAEPAERPWNTPLSLDVAYPASPATLFDPGGGGVLNIR